MLRLNQALKTVRAAIFVHAGTSVTQSLFRSCSSMKLTGFAGDFIQIKPGQK